MHYFILYDRIISVSDVQNHARERKRGIIGNGGTPSTLAQA